MGIRGLVSYEGTTGKELEQDFKQAVDDYLEACRESGTTPEKSFKGSFNIRIPAGLHKKAALLAMASKTSQRGLLEETPSDFTESKTRCMSTTCRPPYYTPWASTTKN